jgi:hypothetical protein
LTAVTAATAAVTAAATSAVTAAVTGDLDPYPADQTPFQIATCPSVNWPVPVLWLFSSVHFGQYWKSQQVK